MNKQHLAVFPIWMITPFLGKNGTWNFNSNFTHLQMVKTVLKHCLRKFPVGFPVKMTPGFGKDLMDQTSKRLWGFQSVEPQKFGKLKLKSPKYTRHSFFRDEIFTMKNQHFWGKKNIIFVSWFFFQSNWSHFEHFW